MSKPKALVVGLGEVGSTLFKIIQESGAYDVYGFDLDRQRMKAVAGLRRTPRRVDVMHICIPYFKKTAFMAGVAMMVERHNPALTIIDSTVPPGTTIAISRKTRNPMAHSPILGLHTSAEHMLRDVRFWPKFVGGTDGHVAELAKQHFEKLGLKVRVLKGPTETELAKIFETTYRAWMISCFQEMHRISRRFNADFADVVSILDAVHEVRHDRPIMFPGVIGGHCLIPNTKLLLESYNSEFLRLILKSNAVREREIEDPDVAAEIETLKKIYQKRENVIEKHIDSESK